MDREFECTRCDAAIGVTDEHTEIVRRDFEGEPQPSRIEYLCGPCWEDYEAFLDGR